LSIRVFQCGEFVCLLVLEIKYLSREDEGVGRRRRRRRGDGRHLCQRAVASKNKGGILRSPNAGTQIFAVL
jgi:hypothetical protein